MVGHIKDCVVHHNYARGQVVAGRTFTQPGGFCGRISGTQTNAVENFWDVQTSGQPASACGTGLHTEAMQSMVSYNDWDFEAVWRICEGTNYPRLLWEPRLPGDFVCPDGVGIEDLMVLADAWLLAAADLPGDIAPDGGDGVVNLLDFAVLAENWLMDTD